MQWRGDSPWRATTRGDVELCVELSVYGELGARFDARIGLGESARRLFWVARLLAYDFSYSPLIAGAPVTIVDCRVIAADAVMDAAAC